MKKTIAILLTLILSLTLCSGAMAKDVESTAFTASFLDSMDQSIDDWYGTSTYRSMIAVMVCFDLYSADNEIGLDALTTAAKGMSYVAINTEGDTLSIIFFSDNSFTLVNYRPDNKTAIYSVTDVDSGMSEDIATYIMEGMVEKGSYKSYYKVSAEDASSSIEIIQSVTNSDK